MYPTTPIPAKGWTLLQYLLGDISDNAALMDLNHKNLKNLIGPIKYTRLLKDACYFCGEEDCLCFGI